MPLGSVHWILMANRRRALEEKMGGDYMTTLKLMGASHLITGSLAPYNAVRMATRGAKQVAGAIYFHSISHGDLFRFALRRDDFHRYFL